MFSKDLSQASRVEVALTALSQARQHLDEHNYASAYFTVGIAKQTLEELQLDFDRRFQAERTFKQLLKQSPK